MLPTDQKPDDLRGALCVLHVGNKGTGKTTDTRNMMLALWEPPQRKPSLVFDPNSQKEYDDLILIGIDDLPNLHSLAEQYARPWFVCREADEAEAFFWSVRYHVRNTVIVFEDATVYMGNNATMSQKSLAAMSRNACNDTFFNFHCLADVPNYLYRLSEILILRQTTDTEIPAKVRVPDVVAEARRQIDRENARLYPPPAKYRLAYRTIDLNAGLIINPNARN